MEMRQELKILSMFMIVQFLGLLLAVQVYSGASFVELPATSGVEASGISALQFIIAILAFTAILLLLFKFAKGPRVFIVIEALAVIGASFAVFLVVIGTFTGTLNQILFGSGAEPYQYAIALIMAVALIVAKNKVPRLRNTVSIIASVGIGMIIGISLSFMTMMVFMALLAVYDYIAVFITKHMVVMGQAAANMNLALMVGAGEAEAIPKKELSASLRKIAERNKAALLRNYGELKRLSKFGLVPIFTRRELGNGDLAVPLAVSVSAYTVYQSFTLCFVIILGAILGLILVFYILRKYQRALPAIPPLLFGILVALAFNYVVTGGAMI